MASSVVNGLAVALLAAAGFMGTAWGHRYDYYVDNLVNVAFFVAMMMLITGIRLLRLARAPVRA